MSLVLTTPSTVDGFKHLDRLLLGNGIFKRFPRPSGFTDTVAELSVGLWRAVLDLAWLELMRGPGDTEETRREYRSWIHWLYEETRDFNEVCELALIDPELARTTITTFVAKRREVYREQD